MTLPENASETPQSASPVATKTPRRSGRWFVRLCLSVALFATAAWFVPEMVARTALRQEVPKLLFPFFKGQVALGETTLGWMSPVVVRDVRVVDQVGEPLFTIGEVRSSATLWQIATDAADLGWFDLRELAATVQSRPDGTNFDQTLADFRNAPAPAKQKSLELVCEGAQVEVTETTGGDPVKLPPIDVHLSVGICAPNAVEVNVTARETTDGTSSLRVHTISSVQGTGDGPVEFELTATRWQLAQLTPLLRRWVGAGQVFGELNGSAKVAVTPAASLQFSCDSDLQIDKLELLGWPTLQGDDLRLERVALTGQLAAVDQVVRCTDVKLLSSAAELTANGAWSLPTFKPATGTNRDPLLALVDEDFQLQGWIDGAELARQLPKTLQLREGTQITSARIGWQLSSESTAAGRVWIGKAGLKELAADANGTPWRWETPVDAQVRLLRSESELVCEQLLVNSEFCRVNGQGTSTNAELQATADLDRLSRQLSAIIDLQQAQIAGLLRLDAKISTGEADRVDLITTANIERLVLGDPRQPLWSEPQLQTTFAVVGSGPGATPWQMLESGRVEMVAGEDRLTIELTEASEWQAANAVIPLKLDLIGDFARWRQRCRPWMSNDVGDLQGLGHFAALVRWSANETVIEKAGLAARPLRWTSPDWQIDEPDLRIQTQGTWSSSAQRYTTPHSSVLASFGRIDWEQGTFDAATQSPVPLAGDLKFDVDLGRLSRWQGAGVQHHLLGTAKGMVRCQAREDALGISLDADVTGLTVAGLETAPSPAMLGVPAGAHWAALWKEPQVHLQTQARYTPSKDEWELRNLKVTGDGVALTGGARSQQTAGRMQFETQGQFDYDWSRLTTRIDPEVSQTLQLTGTGSRPFSLRGQWQLGNAPLFQEVAAVTGNQLTGEVGIGWESAQLMGLPIGPAEIVATFTGDAGSIQPLDLAVAEGRVHLAPQFRFQPGPAIITLSPGRVLDQVRLSPEMCRDSLKFVTPMLADATQIDGRFSLDLAEAAWPLGNTGAGTSSGSLLIHGAQVKPGPLAVQLMTTVEQIRAVVQKRTPRADAADRAVMELPEQTVQFRQADQRVAHDRFIMRFRDVEIQTRGSVGTDESLNLIASIPIRDDWISDERIRTALGGQMLQVPIYGTLRQPQVDPRAIGELARRATGNAIERVIEGRFKDGLEKLLPR